MQHSCVFLESEKDGNISKSAINRRIKTYDFHCIKYAKKLVSLILILYYKDILRLYKSENTNQRKLVFWHILRGSSFYMELIFVFNG